MPIYLDTHVVVWLYAGEVNKLSATAKQQIDENDLLISPVVLLELELLNEIGRITATPDEIFQDLHSQIGLSICPKPFSEVIQQAIPATWTRDPFDRMIVGHAAISDDTLLTKDAQILANYQYAIW